MIFNQFYDTFFFSPKHLCTFLVKNLSFNTQTFDKVIPVQPLWDYARVRSNHERCQFENELIPIRWDRGITKLPDLF